MLCKPRSEFTLEEQIDRTVEVSNIADRLAALALRDTNHCYFASMALAVAWATSLRSACDRPHMGAVLHAVMAAAEDEAGGPAQLMREMAEWLYAEIQAMDVVAEARGATEH